METLLQKMTAAAGAAFQSCGIDPALGKVNVSNRPDLCEYQCNGALAAAKQLHKNPLEIAENVAAILKTDPLFEKAEAVRPGFINLTLAPEAVADYLNERRSDVRLGAKALGEGKTIILDYGGANVAKPLHVGHLRSAIIGEALKRICRFLGFNAVGDVHLGDWGLQMGLIIEELKLRQPELPYFDPEHTGPYPAEAPFTIGDLEEIYPTASAKSKEDAEFAAKAHEATFRLQNGDPGYTALFRHIVNVSVADLKKNYGNLNVTFDLWKGESDAQAYIPAMMEGFREKGILKESEGALVIDVAEESDTKEIPPCLVQKSDGAYLYATTDLATIVQREADYHPDEYFYVTDKRQAMHFLQVFRAARKAGLVRDDCVMTHLGFGTMNGKDGKPFKTRSGGVMRLEYLLDDVASAVYERMAASDMPEEEKRRVAKTVGLAALKYGDLSNQATKDYIFDTERFTSFEGNTGPYILYTIVRIGSILNRYTAAEGVAADELPTEIRPAGDAGEKELQRLLCGAGEVIEAAYAEKAPHKLCLYIYDVANAFNSFYHEHRILTEEDEAKKASWIALLGETKRVLSVMIGLLGFEAPERM
ncbi:MAG: arginine--tRNA ligase [Lachnospiraceae bacterium]|nr:arginine--tRNA ligase [Lachnospiraceae bacterium]